MNIYLEIYDYVWLPESTVICNRVYAAVASVPIIDVVVERDVSDCVYNSMRHTVYDAINEYEY